MTSSKKKKINKIRAKNKFTSFAVTPIFSLSPIGQTTGHNSLPSPGQVSEHLTGGWYCHDNLMIKF